MTAPSENSRPKAPWSHAANVPFGPNPARPEGDSRTLYWEGSSRIGSARHWFAISS